MKCITATMNGNNQLQLRQGITRLVRQAAPGRHLRAWLGHPFAVRAESGPQNEGRRCDFIEVASAFTLEQNGENCVRIDECTLETDEHGRVCLLPHNGGSGNEYLVLLQVTSSESPSEPEQEIELENSPHQIGEGFAINYGRISNSRHPVRFVNSRVEERLLRLQPGQSYRIHTIESESRLFGLVLHAGRKVTYEIKVVGESIRFSKVCSTPLAVPAFDFSSLRMDLGVGLMCVILGIIIGGLWRAHNEVQTTYLIGGAILGATLFLITGIIRLIGAKLTRPTYEPKSSP